TDTNAVWGLIDLLFTMGWELSALILTSLGYCF
ncbi:MAG: hypothetical protein ACI9UV_001728, partial [Algoriphagus sp.]